MSLSDVCIYIDIFVCFNKLCNSFTLIVLKNSFGGAKTNPVGAFGNHSGISIPGFLTFFPIKDFLTCTIVLYCTVLVSVLCFVRQGIKT